MCVKKLFVFFTFYSTVSTQFNHSINCQISLRCISLWWNHLRKSCTSFSSKLFYFLYFRFKGPKLYDRFHSLHGEKKSSDTENDSEGNLFALEGFGKIFEGLADCLTFPRKTSEVTTKKHLRKPLMSRIIINTALGRLIFRIWNCVGM